MALTLQRKLKLAGDLAKVQPVLQRLHLVKKPRQRHHVRNVILVGSAICSVAIGVVMVRRLRGRNDGATPDRRDEAQSESLPRNTPAPDLDPSLIPDFSAQDPA